MTIPTERLFLVPGTVSMLKAAVDEDWPALSAALGGVDMAEHWNHFPDAMEWMHSYLLKHPGDIEWWCYFVIHQADSRLIGTCGYKGAPTPEGTVELGYEIADAYQGRGLATELARALVEHAFSFDAVECVLAHTLATENPSAAVLRKLGFEYVQEIFDLEDGKIWQWQLLRTKI